MKKKKWLLLFSGGITTVIFVILGFVAIAAIVIGLETMSSSCDGDSSGDTTTASAGGAGGSWTQSGTEANKTAKELFDYWTGKGMSGAQAAGIVGNVAGVEDTTFELHKKESGGSGQGLYQFTPGSKYTNNPKSDQSWSVQNQSDVVITLEPGTVKSFFNQTKSSSPSEAAERWMTLYERPGIPHLEKRQAAAEKAYTLFGGASIAAKDSILGDASGTAATGSASDAETLGCSTSGDTSSSGAWGWPFKAIKNKQDVMNGSPLDSQHYGMTSYDRGGGNYYHDGWDFQQATWGGQDVVAVHDGTVYNVAHSSDGRDWHVDVKSDDGWYEIYQEGFLSRSDIAVKEGDKVKVGDKIGTLTGTHLHLGVSKTEIEKAQSSWNKDDGTWKNPVAIISGDGSGDSSSSK